MADETTPPSAAPAKKAGIKRLQIGTNVLIQTIAVLALVVLVNTFAFNRYVRWDFSRDKKYELSDLTKRVLRSLKEDFKVIVFFSGDPSAPGGEIYPDVQNLLTEYQYGSKRKIDIENIDPNRNMSRARELVAKYKIARDNVVIIDYQGRSKVINASDMVDYDQSMAMMGQPPRVSAFKGEQALTSALIEVSEEKQQTIDFLEGQGEPELEGGDAAPLATLKLYVEQQNLKTTALNLLNVQKIPETTKVIAIIGAKYDLSDREVGMLREFWQKQGRLLVLLDPDSPTPKLDAFIKECGITVHDDRVLTTLTIAQGITGVVKEPAALFVSGSPITKRLKDVGTRFRTAVCSLGLEQAPQLSQSGTKLMPLIQAVDGFWGETNYAGGENTPVAFDPQKDQGPPVVIAASMEKGAVGDERVKVGASRMVVAGNSSMAAEAISGETVDFLLGCINWLIDREELIGIAPKQPSAFSLNLSEGQVARIGWLAMGIFPTAAALLGFGVWYSRRR